MATVNKSPVRPPLWIGLAFALVAIGVWLAYVMSNPFVADGDYLLPLDDVYIHFQYARQMAEGQPFVYNPSQPPTSGATSFLYPVLLALGYRLGFQGLSLSLWAMILGAAALYGSMHLLYRLVRVMGAGVGVALFTALSFALTGSIAWHHMSGMETGIVIFLLLWTLYAFIWRDFWRFILAASLFALIRPEGSLLAVIAVLVYGARGPRNARSVFLFIPVLMLGVQPLVNFMVTGSFVASGNSAKSVLGVVPFDVGVVLERLLSNFGRMWLEFLTGYSPREGWYLLPGLGVIALLSLIWLWRQREGRWISALLVLWLLAGSAAITSLDTAFWHFKRYQMPLMALFFPLVAWGINALWLQRGRWRVLVGPLAVVIGVFTLFTAQAFLGHFALNVGYVYAQPLQMARWLAANTPEDAVIAVHDVGMMRYMGQRTTLDMVGLTTPGASDYWRNGPGSVLELLLAQKPDYIASYGAGHGFGLGMLADTRLYENPLAEFRVTLDPHYNVALAAETQGIYALDWDALAQAMPTVEGEIRLNVADIASENIYAYETVNRETLAGFPTLPYDLPLDGVPLLQGVRVLNGAESFSVPVVPGQALQLETLLHPASVGRYSVYANDRLIEENWIPEMPGRWMWAYATIPAEVIETDMLHLRLEADMGAGTYQPALHRLTPLTESPVMGERIVDYQDGAFGLTRLLMTQADAALTVEMDWESSSQASGDYRFFLHVYADLDQPPVAQYDAYLGGVPVGSWPHHLPETVHLSLSDVPAGTYHVALGFYNPVSLERLHPVSSAYEALPDGRLLLDMVELPPDE
jgi:hypothetical protein